jgi:hypothetical protein
VHGGDGSSQAPSSGHEPAKVTSGWSNAVWAHSGAGSFGELGRADTRAMTNFHGGTRMLDLETGLRAYATMMNTLDAGAIEPSIG